jgi:hypothetical protein
VAINVESSTSSEKELKDVNSGKPAPAPPHRGLTIAATGSGLEDSVQAELDHAVGPYGKDPSLVPVYESRENLRELGKFDAQDEKDFGKDFQKNATPKGLQKKIDKLIARAKGAEHELKKFRESASRNELQERAKLQIDAPGQLHRDTPQVEIEQPTSESTPPQSSNGAATLPEHVVREAREKYIDWDETFRAADRANISAPIQVANEIQRLSNAGDVLYTIAKNPQLAAQIQDPVRGIEIVRSLGQDLALAGEHAGRMAESVKKQPLLDEDIRTAKNIRLTMNMARAIMQQENSADIVRWLARNPQQFASSPSEAAAIAQIGRIASQLETETARRTERPRSRLNPPIKPVGGGGVFTPVDLAEAAETSQSAYRKARGGRAGRFD